jgi:hypothetical protein
LDPSHLFCVCFGVSCIHQTASIAIIIQPSPSSPDPPSLSAYLYLAQLTEDDPYTHAALVHYQSAVDILNAQLKGKGKGHVSEDNEAESELESNLNIVRALVGMVEIWMDPSCGLWYVTWSQFLQVCLFTILPKF